MLNLIRTRNDGPGNIPVPPVSITEIVLVYFKAEPAQVEPFGSTVIKWKLDMHGSPAQIRLNGTIVASTGSLTVHPQSNRDFYLSASIGNWERNFGPVEVTVNTNACVRKSYTTVHQYVLDLFQVEAENRLGLNFRNSPFQNVQVVITDGNIHFALQMSYALSDIPDPQVDITGDFGFTVVPDSFLIGQHKVEAVMRNLNIDVHYSAWQWIEIGFEGPAFIAATLAEGTAKDNVTNGMPGLIDIITLSLAFTTAAPTGMGIENIVLSAGDNGLGTLTSTYCPNIPKEMVE